MLTGCGGSTGGSSSNQTTNGGTTQTAEKSGGTTSADEEKEDTKENEQLMEGKNELTDKYGDPLDDEGTVFKDEDGNYIIVNDNKDVVASSENSDFSEYYASGDGYYALLYQQAGFDYNDAYLYIINSKGEEIRRIENLSQYPYTFFKADNGIINLTSGERYCGNGCFVFEIDRRSTGYPSIKGTKEYYSCKSNRSITVEYNTSAYALLGNDEERSLNTFYFDDDTTIDHINTTEGLQVYDDELNLRYDLGKLDSYGPSSNGGFIYYKEDKLLFFDYETGESSEICKNSEKIQKNKIKEFKFIDGKADITLNGDDGQTYHAVVDKKGNYIEEPHK